MAGEHVRSRFSGSCQQRLQIMNDLLARTKGDVASRVNTTNGSRCWIALSEVWPVVIAHPGDLADFWHHLLPRAYICPEPRFEDDGWTATSGAGDVKGIAANIDAPIDV